MLNYDFASASPYVNKIMQAVSELASGKVKEFMFRSDCSLNNPERYRAILDLVMTVFTETCSGIEACLGEPVNPFAERQIESWLKASDYSFICESAEQMKGPVPNGYVIEGSVQLHSVSPNSTAVILNMRSLLVQFNEACDITTMYPITVISVTLSQFFKE